MVTGTITELIIAKDEKFGIILYNKCKIKLSYIERPNNVKHRRYIL